MDPSQLKAFILAQWTRYSVSWIAKGLAAWLGYNAVTANSTAAQLSAGGGAVIAIVIDMIHDHYATKSDVAKGAASTGN